MPEMETRIVTVGETRTANVYGVAKDARIVFEQDAPARMRDGIDLMTNVFRPDKAGKFPAIVSLAPYGKHTLPPDDQFARIPNTGVLRFSELTGWETPDPVFWVPHDYVVINADCRATNQSGGDRFEHLSPQMGQDFHDLVEWAASQDWCDGNVGANGVSYLCATQWLGASENPPHLGAIIPWEGFNDFYRDHAFHGGIPDTNFFRQIWGRRMNSETGFVAKGATAEDIVAAQKERPLLDAFWQAKQVDLSKITVPAYVVAGWATQGLHTRGAIEGFKQIASRDKWLEAHGRKEWETYYTRESLERQRRFFDCFLKGQESGIRDLPRVRVEVRDRFYEGRTRFFDDFPIPDTDYQKLYLDGSTGTLDREPMASASAHGHAALKSDAEPDRAEYSITFDKATDIVGHMKLRLWVSAEDADDLDLHVAVRKFDRHGNEVYFADFQHYEQGVAASGWLRASHRELDEERSTPWQPWLRHQRLLKLNPGEVVPVEIEILPSGTGFLAGDKLNLVVQGYDIIDFPARFKHEETVNHGRHIIHTGGQYDSHLLIPVIPGP